MNHIIVVILLVFLTTLRLFGELDKGLLIEIKEWRIGSAPPARLLRFPDGKIALVPACGLRVWGSAVGDYIGEIKDADLLVALALDNRSDRECFQASTRQLIRLKGVQYLSTLLAEKRRSDPRLFLKTEFAVLAQLLCSPYATVKAARIAKLDMEQTEAERVLNEMKSALGTGKDWTTVYSKFAEKCPDLRVRADEPKVARTLICFLYDGIISPKGFDLLTCYVDDALPPEHLRSLFVAKQGTHILKRVDGAYLYHIESYFSGLSN